MSRRVCLAIGVSNVIPPAGQESRFANLDGAPGAAEAIGQWALRSGFGAGNVRVVTDQALPDGESNPVTAERVQAAVNELFPANGPETDHLILTFCGHGLTADVGSTFWLFSDALEQQYRVNVDAFISELLTFGIKRLSLISDACRDAPKDLDLMRLDSRRGIRGRQAQNDSPMFDRLAACQDGQKSYMLVDRTAAAPGKCILSGVVLDVLWGHEPDAFKNNVIDTHSFGNFTRDRAAARATQYGLKLRPQCMVDPQAALLVDGAARPSPALELPPWPPPASVTAMGAVEEAIAAATPTSGSFERLHFSKAFRDTMLGEDFGTSHPALDPSAGFTGLPEHTRVLVDHLVALRKLRLTNLVEADISSTISALEGEAARHARAAAADMLNTSLEDVASETVGLVVPGGKVAHIWSEGSVSKGRDAGNTIEFRIETDLGAQFLVQFDDGVFVPVYVYPRLFAVLLRSQNGMAAIAYGARDTEVFFHSAKALDQLISGALDSTQIESLAARMRDGKHANPVLGTIAAYLYRQVSDFDNLRRMAYYFVRHQQPIPFDIALLGQMDVYAEGGNYFARVPAVQQSQGEREKRNPLPKYATNATPAVTGPLAGRCPWLTLGWDYPPGERFGDRVYEECRNNVGLLRRSSFTSLAPELGERLARAWNLKRW